MQEPVIVGAVRTAIGRLGGALSTVTDRTLASLVIKEVVNRAGVPPARVEEVIFSQQYRTTGELPTTIARPVAVDAGIPIEVSAFNVSKACGSSVKAVCLAAQAIKAGDAQLLVAGGVESMSTAAYLVPGGRWGHRLGHGRMLDPLVFYDPLSGYNMGETAENVAQKYQVSRADQDQFALVSQQKAARAQEQGLFEEQIVAVPIPQKRGEPKQFLVDEHPRPETTLEQLGKMKAIFREGGSVTAGNSSGMNDAASAAVVASRECASELGLKPLVSIVTYASVGVDPALMGIGPIPATKMALDKAGLTVGDLDLVEINEAFASQSLACIRELDLDEAKVNVNGGAIALGHPISATGTILITKLIYELRRRGLELGLVTLCLGGGQGMAIILRNED